MSLILACIVNDTLLTPLIWSVGLINFRFFGTISDIFLFPLRRNKVKTLLTEKLYNTSSLLDKSLEVTALTPLYSSQTVKLNNNWQPLRSIIGTSSTRL